MSTLLLVEDDPQLRRALALTLRSRGYSVTDVGDGASALDLLARSRVDAVILDLGLPDIDGIDVIRRLRPGLSTPIVVLSARRDQSDTVAALDAGADDDPKQPLPNERRHYTRGTTRSPTDKLKPFSQTNYLTPRRPGNQGPPIGEHPRGRGVRSKGGEPSAGGGHYNRAHPRWRHG